MGVAREPVKSSREGLRLDFVAKMFSVKSSYEGRRQDFVADTTQVTRRGLIASRPTRSSEEGSQLGLRATGPVDPLAGDTGSWTCDVGFGKLYILEKAGGDLRLGQAVGFGKPTFGLGLKFGFGVVLGLRSYDK